MPRPLRAVMSPASPAKRSEEHTSELQSLAAPRAADLLLIGCLALPVQFARAQDSSAAPNAAPTPGGDVTSFSGKVVEFTNTASYTYVLVDTGSKKLWAAAVEFAVKVGDNVTVASGMPMANYHSKTLNRDFDVVYFTGGITVNGSG